MYASAASMLSRKEKESPLLCGNKAESKKSSAFACGVNCLAQRLLSFGGWKTFIGQTQIPLFPCGAAIELICACSSYIGVRRVPERRLEGRLHPPAGYAARCTIFDHGSTLAIPKTGRTSPCHPLFAPPPWAHCRLQCGPSVKGHDWPYPSCRHVCRKSHAQ